MLKTLMAQIKEYKKDSLKTPAYMILEVIMETFIPLLMASIVDNLSLIHIWHRLQEPCI